MSASAQGDPGTRREMQNQGARKRNAASAKAEHGAKPQETRNGGPRSAGAAAEKGTKSGNEKPVKHTGGKEGPVERLAFDPEIWLWA